MLNSVGYKILQIEQVPYNLCSVESLAKYVCYEASPVKLKGALPKEIVVQIDDKVVNLASFIKQIKEVERGRIKEYLRVHSDAQYIERTGEDSPIWEIKSDIALPCATQNELTLNSAKKLVENGSVKSLSQK